MLDPTCVVFPLVGTQSSIEDGTLCESVSQLDQSDQMYFLAIIIHVTLVYLHDILLKV